MASATTPRFKPLSMAGICQSLSTLKNPHPFSSLLSKPIKNLHLTHSVSPSSWNSLQNNKLPSNSFLTLVASTSDWAPQEEVGPPVDSEYVDPPEDAKLYVGNFPYDVTSEQLAHLFEEAGTVQVCEVIYDRETQRSRGFGFVWMQTVEEAEKAINMFNRYDLNGRYLTVNKAAPRGSRPERSPRSFEPSFRIYVGNLPWQVDDARLEQMFSEHGKVVQARVVLDRDTGRSRGFGFVTMSTQSELDDAIEAMDGQSLDGRAIRVNVAEERPRRTF